MVKVNDYYGGWGFSCNLLSVDGNEISGLKFDPPALASEKLIVKNITASSAQDKDINSYSPLYLIDGESWQEIYSTDSDKGGCEVIPLKEPVEAKLLKLLTLERGTDWGCSLWEIEIYGKKQ